MRYVIRNTQYGRQNRRLTSHVSRLTGFTLIELLVVISIIGILASLALVSYSGAQKQTRDTQRRSDLAQYRNGLETYAAANNGAYTSRNTKQPAATYPCDKLKPDFISACPVDPSTYTYYYLSDGAGYGNPVATKYALWVQLETGGYWEVCSDGRSGKVAVEPNSSTCALP